MPADLLFAFVTGVVTAMVTSHRNYSKAVRLQQDILRRGQLTYGRVLRVWRLPVLKLLTRIQFEFKPADSEEAVRCWHNHHCPDEPMASLPAPGRTVRVHYLPDDPARAVISNLVPRR